MADGVLVQHFKMHMARTQQLVLQHTTSWCFFAGHPAPQGPVKRNLDSLAGELQPIASTSVDTSGSQFVIKMSQGGLMFMDPDAKIQK